MSRKNIENVYSLSPLQEGLLFHALYASQRGVYAVNGGGKGKSLQQSRFQIIPMEKAILGLGVGRGHCAAFQVSCEPYRDGSNRLQANIVAGPDL